MDEYLTLIKLAVIAGSFLLALLLESLILPQVLRIAYKKRLYDLPNARKVHKTPTPRLGGISFMPVIVIVLGLMAVARLRWVTDTVLSQFKGFVFLVDIHCREGIFSQLVLVNLRTVGF